MNCMWKGQNSDQLINYRWINFLSSPKNKELEKMTSHALSLSLKQSGLYGSLFKKSIEPNICPWSQNGCSCPSSSLAPFLLSQGCHVHVPYGLHIWWPVKALLGGKRISSDVLYKYISVESATAHICKYLGPKSNA